ncbi:hypothetical protein [Arthrobacter sp. TmT3-37]
MALPSRTPRPGGRARAFRLLMGGVLVADRDLTDRQAKNTST